MKIRFGIPEFRRFQERVTKCNMTVDVIDCNKDVLKNLRLFEFLNETCIEVGETSFGFEVEAITKCSPKDTLDKVVGERVAESKATIKALKVINAVLTKGEKALRKSLVQNSNDLLRLEDIMLREKKHLTNLMK